MAEVKNIAPPKRFTLKKKKNKKVLKKRRKNPKKAITLINRN